MLKGVPQVMDVTSIKSIIYYISNEILPSKFEIAQQPEPNTIQMGFRGINNLSWIEVSWQGDCARIIKIKKPEKIGTESTLAKQLTYGLKYTALVSIKQYEFERIIKFEFAKKPGDEIIKYLIFELMGKHSNLFYLDKNFKVIAAGKQIKSTQSSFRTISTGTIYTNPPKNNKLLPDLNETFENWKENILLFPESLKNSLINTYQGVSPILTKQIEYVSDLEIKDVMSQNTEFIDDKYLKIIFESWRNWIKSFKSNKFNFSIFDNYFYSVWFSSFKSEDRNFIDLSEGLGNYYDYHLKLRKIDFIFTKIDGLIFRQETTEKKNLNFQIKLLESSENHEELKIKADNIFLNLKLSKADILKAEKLYKKSKKLKRSKNLIKERFNIHQNKLLRLDEYKVLLDNIKGNNIDKLSHKIKLLEELKDELVKEFNLKINSTKTIKKKLALSISSPIQINSPNGLVIQIGRNMRQNDLISFKLAKKQDLWFHAQESPGSHVVLKSSTKFPADSDIQISADIAAYFSRAKRNIKVPINFVKIKDLNKISKSSPGCVSFTKFKIIWGNPTRGKEYLKNNLQS